MINILSPSSRIEMMRSFDDLPDRIRRAIAAADFPYDPREILARLQSGRRVAVVARSIESRSTLP